MSGTEPHRLAIPGIFAVYVGYAFLFLSTQDGALGWFWVNNDFFWPVFWAAALAWAAWAVWGHVRRRSLGRLRAAASVILAIGFLPFTYLLPVALYVT